MIDDHVEPSGTGRSNGCIGCVISLGIFTTAFVACWLVVRQDAPRTGAQAAPPQTPARTLFAAQTGNSGPYPRHDWLPAQHPLGMRSAATAAEVPALPIAQTRVLVGAARRPAGTNYLQGVRLAGSELWGNAGKCCTSPPWPPTGWEALYRYPLSGTRWEWVAGGNSTKAVDGVPAGDMPSLDEWEAGSPRPVTVGSDTLVAYLATRWSAYTTKEPRAQVGNVRINGSMVTHGIWIPKADAESQIAPWGLTTDGTGQTWLYTLVMGPSLYKYQRRSVNVATAELGQPVSVSFEDGQVHAINDIVYSATTGSYWGLESQASCDSCWKEACTLLNVWESQAVSVPMKLDAGIFWRKVGTIAGPDGWSIFEGHWNRSANGQRLEPWSLTASLAPVGAYAQSDLWEVAVLQTTGASLPASMTKLLGPVPVAPVVTPTPTPTPTKTPTPVPTPTPQPTAPPLPAEGIYYPPVWQLTLPRSTTGIAPHLAAFQCGNLGCSVSVDGVTRQYPASSGGEIVARREAVVWCTGCVRLWGTSGGQRLEPVTVPLWGGN